MKKIIYVSALIICVWSLNLNEITAQIYFGTNTLSATGSALGTGNTSNSSYTFASGQSSQATNSYSFAHGFGVQAYGQYAGSMGVLSYANGSRSYSYGEVARATGSYSYSFGKSVNSTGNHSFAIGNSSTASGLYGYVFGVASQAVGDYSFAIGRYSVTNGNNSYSIGEYVSTSSANSTTIGRGVNSSTKLDNNQSNTLMVGFNSTIPTFFVGASSGSGTTGKVGIATSSPIRTFDVNGMSHFSDTMSIGTTKTNGSMLAVAGKISAEEVEISFSSTWPDFVFSTSYELNTLAQVEEYITKHSHLPNVPSAEDVAKNGINIAEMDAILLQKIEELTLYTIAQQKQLDEQQKLIEEQSKLVEALIKDKK
ncbi:MAG: hypothetical protein CVT95_05545 [Bacteroidetes bacterium HGW-Bacteroidetes-12]|nr:MAG: hypothetical protein CVT95_05545 [Bacteroidetes bacterium HGW-Bacteroidetes-12]